MAAKLTRLTHKIAIQLHLVAESCIICSCRSRRPVRKLLIIPSYVHSKTELEYRVNQRILEQFYPSYKIGAFLSWICSPNEVLWLLKNKHGKPSMNILSQLLHSRRNIPECNWQSNCKVGNVNFLWLTLHRLNAVNWKAVQLAFDFLTVMENETRCQKEHRFFAFVTLTITQISHIHHHGAPFYKLLREVANKLSSEFSLLL
jgi:hypothetical protein